MIILDIFTRLITVLLIGGAISAAFRFMAWRSWGYLKARGQISRLYHMMVFVSAASVALIPGWIVYSIYLFYHSIHGSGDVRGWFVMQIGIWERGIFISIWIAGVIFEIFWIIMMYRRFESMLAASNVVVTDKSLLNMLEQFSAQAGLRSTPLLFENAAVKSPFVKGPCSPVIILPLRQMSKREMFIILAHEVEHCCRRDILVRWLVKVSQVIYWFVPGHKFWMEEIIELQESLCDQSVCCRYKEILGTSASYYQTILEVSLAENQIQPFFCSGLGEIKSQLRRRVENVYAVQKVKGKKCQLAICSIILICTAGLLLSPVIAFAYGHFSYARQEETCQDGDSLMVDIEEVFDIVDCDENAERVKIFDEYSEHEIPAGESVIGDLWECGENVQFQGFAVASSPDYEILLIGEDRYFRMIPKDGACTFQQDITPGQYYVEVQNNSQETLSIELFVQK